MRELMKEVLKVGINEIIKEVDYISIDDVSKQIRQCAYDLEISVESKEKILEDRLTNILKILINGYN